MIRIRDISKIQIIIHERADPSYAGTGPILIEISEGAPAPPVISNGISLEDGTSFLMLEDTTSYLLQEA